MHFCAAAGNYLKLNISVSKTQPLITALKGCIVFASANEALEFSRSLCPLDSFQWGEMKNAFGLTAQCSSFTEDAEGSEA